jgi:glycosyltransferase involved in cell wall biosynthesis
MSRTVEPRVLHVIPNLDHGGAQEVVCTLAETQRGIGGFFACTFADGPLRARLEAAAVPPAVVSGPRCRFSNPIRYAAELRRIERELADLVAAWRIDVIQTHLLNVVDAVVLRLQRAPRRPAVVWTFHGPEFLPLRPGPTLPLRRLACRWLYRANLRRVDAIVTVSEGVRDAVVRQLGPAAAKARVIGNAPNPTKYSAASRPELVRAELGLGPDAQLVLFVGRLAEEKGCRHLVEAIPAVLARFPGAVALLAGTGPEREKLEALVRRTGVAGHVRFLGIRDDVADLLAAADVVCLPSLHEGLSLALLEAMSAGRPVVASDIPENRVLIEPGTTGILVPASDPDGLAEGLITILSDPERARQMGRAARRHALASFTVERQTERYAALYRELCSASARR